MLNLSLQSGSPHMVTSIFYIVHDFTVLSVSLCKQRIQGESCSGLLSVHAHQFVSKCHILLFFPIAALLPLSFFHLPSPPLCPVFFLSLSHSHIYTNAHTLCLSSSRPGGVWGCGSMWKPSHRERLMCSSFEAICPKHAVSLHLDMCVCQCVCVLVFVYVSMTRSGWGECLCQCFACTKGKALFLYTHTCGWDRVVRHCAHSPHSGHIFIWLWFLRARTKRALCRIRVPRYLLSA